MWLCVPGWLRLKVYRVLLRNSEETSSPRAHYLGFGLYAKCGHHTTVVEALATHFVATNTSIPAPNVLDVLADKKMGTFFLMSRVPGRPLRDMDGTLDSVSPKQLAAFKETMDDWLTQLRALTPPNDDIVSGFLGGPLFSFRIDMNRHVGPFPSTSVFHAQPFCTLRSIRDPFMLALVERVRAKQHRLCFTYGDISPTNILVDDNYRPTGLVDWECAAWMPEYWELAATLWRRQRYTAWFESFSEILPQYRDEMVVERELWKIICPW